MNIAVRVRFAPSPTGLMHLGNVRTALINYLFARHYQGTFIVRIEDTDQQRMFDERAQGILQDLQWLDLIFQEGPGIGGPSAPYYQSERNAYYQEYLDLCIEQKKVYRCFCTAEELEKKRDRQIAQKLPPRYDRTCLNLHHEVIHKNLDAGIPFIWRFRLPDESVTITDLARGSITYDLKNFSDFAVTRQDGTCTFIFANFVDDVLMHITHVIRGEDHLSNTANQAALYVGLNKKLPLFWHLPIIANTDGKKLSKRDFGFSLHDLRNAGYLPEAITNYLAILGGSFKETNSSEGEIMPLSEIVSAFNFDHISSTGQIKYDIEKLRWFNQKWIQKISFEDFKSRIARLFEHKLDAQFDALLMAIKPELMTLHDVVEKTRFYFEAPHINVNELSETEKAILPLLKDILSQVDTTSAEPETFIKKITGKAKALELPIKSVYALLRIALTGHAQGLGIKELITLLGHQESYKRFSALITE
ncbi:MAG: glutamate--tRNA ligase [Candidatus Babeliaceae bacterium]|nr:glutamate--tRNA ligase [Candidatus Babeliaceae bacterium]